MPLHKEIVFSSGELSKIITASCAIPGVYMPVKYKNTVVATAKDTNGVYSAGDRANIYFYKGIVD